MATYANITDMRFNMTMVFSFFDLNVNDFNKIAKALREKQPIWDKRELIPYTSFCFQPLEICKKKKSVKQTIDNINEMTKEADAILLFKAFLILFVSSLLKWLILMVNLGERNCKFLNFPSFITQFNNIYTKIKDNDNI